MCVRELRSDLIANVLNACEETFYIKFVEIVKILLFFFANLSVVIVLDFIIYKH